MRHQDQRFDKARVELDGNEFEGCTFTACTFVFSGGGPFRLSNSSLSSECRFEFAGAASHTLGAMSAIYSMGEWGRRTVLKTFQSIAPDIKNLS